MKNLKSIIWGLVLITLGIIIGLNAFEIINVDIFFDGWWTLFIIVPCFIGIITEENKLENIIDNIKDTIVTIIIQVILLFFLFFFILSPKTKKI